jgi:hypothetical protein
MPVIGAVVLYGVSRRAGRGTADRRARRDRATDSRTVLSAATAAVAQQIVDRDGRTDADKRLAVDYAELLEDIAAADRAGEDDFSELTERANALNLGPKLL